MVELRFSFFDERGKVISELSKDQPFTLGVGFSGLNPGNIPFFLETGQLREKPRTVSTFHSKFAERGVVIFNVGKGIMEVFSGQFHIIKKRDLGPKFHKS